MTDLSSLKIERRKPKNSTMYKKKFIVATFIVLFIIIIIALGFLLWTVVFSNKIEVKVATAFKRTQAETNAVLTASGYIVAQRKASVASKATGRLIYLGVVKIKP